MNAYKAIVCTLIALDICMCILKTLASLSDSSTIHSNLVVEIFLNVLIIIAITG